MTMSEKASSRRTVCWALSSGLCTRIHRRAGVARSLAELFFDRHKTIVFCGAIAAGERARLDLARAGRDGEIGDGRVFGLSRTMGDNRAETGLLRHRYAIERLGERSDLVHLDEDCVRGGFFDAAFEEAHVGDEEIVADELDALPERLRQRHPAGPIALREAVFDRDDRIVVTELGVERDHIVGG